MKLLTERPYYKLFKQRWLGKFKGYYKKGRVSKEKLKDNVFAARYLTEGEKENFWRLVSGK